MMSRRHIDTQSLSSEKITKIVRLTSEILDKEGLGFIPIRIKPKVWKTAFITKGTQNIYTKEFKVEVQFIQFGGIMLTGSIFPKAIYYISIYDPNSRVVQIKRPYSIMLADIVGSTILEEIAHAIVFNEVTLKQRIRAQSHGAEFIGAFRLLWIKYFITLKFELMSIYGTHGVSGEDVL